MRACFLFTVAVYCLLAYAPKGYSPALADEYGTVQTSKLKTRIRERSPEEMRRDAELEKQEEKDAENANWFTAIFLLLCGSGTISLVALLIYWGITAKRSKTDA